MFQEHINDEAPTGTQAFLAPEFLTPPAPGPEESAYHLCLRCFCWNFIRGSLECSLERGEIGKGSQGHCNA